MKKEAIFRITIIVIALVFILGLIGAYYFRDNSVLDGNNNSAKLKCERDSDCVPSSCCHASSCSNIEEAPKCNGIFCTQVCEPNTLDCGQAFCKCINNKCNMVKNE